MKKLLTTICAVLTVVMTTSAFSATTPVKAATDYRARSQTKYRYNINGFLTHEYNLFYNTSSKVFTATRKNREGVSEYMDFSLYGEYQALNVKDSGMVTTGYSFMTGVKDMQLSVSIKMPNTTTDWQFVNAGFDNGYSMFWIQAYAGGFA